MEHVEEDEICNDPQYDFVGEPYANECPAFAPKSAMERLVNRRVVVFFTEYKKWFNGVIQEVYPRRKLAENFLIKFDVDERAAHTRLDPESYGPSKNWVLLVEPLAQMAEASAETATAEVAVEASQETVVAHDAETETESQ